MKYFLPSITLRLLANALVFPHFDYCSPGIFAQTVFSDYSNSLQILQNKFARILLSADIRTTICDMINELSWDKLDVRWTNHNEDVVGILSGVHLPTS